MKEYTLACFKDFKCKAEECTDSCCIGWGVDIDKKTLEYYKEYEGNFKERLTRGIDFESSEIIMQKDGRCPFLNEKNLCDIILSLGEEHISYICTKHPRFYNFFEAHTEMGYGLCCEEATRLLLEGEVSLCERPDTDNPLFFLREKLFDIIKDKSLSVRDKICCFLDLVCEAEEILFFGGSLEEFLNTYKFKAAACQKSSLLPFLKEILKTEPIDEAWETKINKVIRDIEKIEDNLYINSKKCESLLYYYTFRYFLKDIEDEDLVGKAKQIIALLLLNIIFDTHSYINSESDFNKNTVLISKQIEYSSFNLSYIRTLALENEVLDYEKIISYI